MNMDHLLTIGVIALMLIIIWMFAVGDLMIRRDDEFPGKSDKLGWAIILTFTGVFGAFIYLIHRLPSKRTSNSTGDEATAEEQLECMECGAMIPAGAANAVRVAGRIQRPNAPYTKSLNLRSLVSGGSETPADFKRAV